MLKNCNANQPFCLKSGAAYSESLELIHAELTGVISVDLGKQAVDLGLSIGGNPNVVGHRRRGGRLQNEEEQKKRKVKSFLGFFFFLYEMQVPVRVLVPGILTSDGVIQTNKSIKIKF